MSAHDDAMPTAASSDGGSDAPSDSASAPPLSVVMPCYNEEGCIEEVVRDWISEIGSKIPEHELIVVNDGSRDASGEILDRLAEQLPQLRVHHQKNAGHGPALRAGLEAARGEWIFHVDSDNQFRSADFWTLWDARDTYRYMTGIRVQRHDPLHRLVITRILRVLMFLFFGVWVRDSNVPYKLVGRPELDMLLELVPRDVFAPSIFLTVAAAKLVPFKEFQVTHLPRETGTISIVRLGLLKACFRCVGELASFRSALRAAVRRGAGTTLQAEVSP